MDILYIVDTMVCPLLVIFWKDVRLWWWHIRGFSFLVPNFVFCLCTGILALRAWISWGLLIIFSLWKRICARIGHHFFSYKREKSSDILTLISLITMQSSAIKWWSLALHRHGHHVHCRTCRTCARVSGDVLLRIVRWPTVIGCSAISAEHENVPLNAFKE